MFSAIPLPRRDRLPHAVTGHDDAEEEMRLGALQSYDILDTAPEAAFDRIVALARVLFGVPIALVTFVDAHRQWFKARAGLAVSETPRDQAFCAHAIRERGVMVVRDAQADPRFADNPLVTGDPFIRFYAGAPIVTPDGIPLGTVCVISPEPRADFAAEDLERLEVLAGITANELQLRRESARSKRLAVGAQLFAQEAQHRVRSSLHLVTTVLEAQASRTYDRSVRQALYEAVDRISSVEQVHQQLRPEGSGFGDDAEAYLLALLDCLEASMADVVLGRRILLSVEAGLRIDGARLAQIGMVVAELVMNALRHGRGTVRVAAHRESADIVRVSAADEGRGFGREHGPVLARGRLGLRLVSFIAEPGGVFADPDDSQRIVVRIAG